MENNLNNEPEVKEQEIDLMEIAAKLWAKRTTICKWCGVGVIIGLVVAFSIPREYSTQVKLSPELATKTPGNGGLSTIASMAGINLNAGNTFDAVYPELYPDVLSSAPFMVDILSVSVPDKEGNVYTVDEILEDHTSSPWWSTVIGLPFKALGAVKAWFSDDDEEGGDSISAFRLTPKQAAKVESLSKRVMADVNNKTFVTTVSVMMQDPVASAHLADTVVSRLQEYVTKYRTEKARKDLDYARKINDEARQSYAHAQEVYASASDRNHALSSKSAAIEIERLQNEASLAFNLYNTTAQQLQMAEAKVQENTPVFAIVQPATVPVKPSKPSKAMILIAFVFLSFVAAAAYILYFPKLTDTLSKVKHPEIEE